MYGAEILISYHLNVGVWRSNGSRNYRSIDLKLTTEFAAHAGHYFFWWNYLNFGAFTAVVNRGGLPSFVMIAKNHIDPGNSAFPFVEFRNLFRGHPNEDLRQTGIRLLL
jgi:hypothetical protein